MIAAGICMMTAGYFLWRRDFNTAFVVAALGAVSWFLNYRVQMREITRAADFEETTNRKPEQDLYEE